MRVACDAIDSWLAVPAHACPPLLPVELRCQWGSCVVCRAEATGWRLFPSRNNLTCRPIAKGVMTGEGRGRGRDYDDLISSIGQRYTLRLCTTNERAWDAQPNPASRYPGSRARAPAVPLPSRLVIVPPVKQTSRQRHLFFV